MGLLNNILNSAKSNLESQARSTVAKGLNNAAFNATNKIAKGLNKKEKFTFAALPTSVEELKAMPEISLDTPYKTVALTLAVLCNFKNDPEATYAMLDVLRGPDPMSPAVKQMIAERLTDAEYKPFSFFEGAKPDNDYTPDKPYKITVMSNTYSFDNENWAHLLVQSNGADSERKIVLREKPSTKQWFLNDIQCLADIRIPTSQNPWA